MRTKSLVLFRSKFTGFEEGKMEKALVPDPRTVWEPSTVKEEQIQALADRGLLRPKTQVGWRLAVGEEFPTEGSARPSSSSRISSADSASRWAASYAASSTSTASRWFIWCQTRLPSSLPSSTSARPTFASLHTSTSSAISSS
jgi:hypothetical protein